MRVQANDLLSQRSHSDNNRNNQEKEIKPFHFQPPEIQLRFKITAITTITTIMQKKSASFIFLSLDRNQRR